MFDKVIQNRGHAHILGYIYINNVSVSKMPWQEVTDDQRRSSDLEIFPKFTTNTLNTFSWLHVLIDIH